MLEGSYWRGRRRERAAERQLHMGRREREEWWVAIASEGRVLRPGRRLTGPLAERDWQRSREEDEYQGDREAHRLAGKAARHRMKAGSGGQGEIGC